MIGARFPERGPGLLGDKAHSMVFDNTKVRAFVPGFRCVIPYHEGLRRSLAWLEAAPGRKVVDPPTDAEIDALAALHGRIGSL